jgi:hypothetical protein
MRLVTEFVSLAIKSAALVASDRNLWRPFGICRRINEGRASADRDR